MLRTGKYGGVGIQIGLRRDTLTVLTPFEDSPAYSEGIHSGDQILMIDSVSTKGMSLKDASKLIKGELGSVVELTIYRPSARKKIIFKLSNDQKLDGCGIMINLDLDGIAKEITNINILNIFGDTIFFNYFDGSNSDIWDGNACSMPDHSIFLKNNKSVIFNSSTGISSFQFDIDGATIINAYGGLAEEVGFRAINNKNKSFSLTRANIVIKHVPYWGVDENGIGYIRILKFSRNSARDFANALDDLISIGMNGLIIDLRGNSGGLLNMVVTTKRNVGILDMITDRNTELLETKGRIKKANKLFKTRMTSKLMDEYKNEIPLAVLINRSSASASEILAGVVQDLDRGVIVGEKSFGKGLVQSMYNLNDTTTLKVTTAKYYTPSGRLIQKEDYLNNGFLTDGLDKKDSLFVTRGGRTVKGGGGITPDVEIKRTSLPPYVQELWREGVFLTFAAEYVPMNGIESPIIITDKIYRDFEVFLEEYEINYKLPGEKDLNKLKIALRSQDDLKKITNTSILSKLMFWKKSKSATLQLTEKVDKYYQNKRNGQYWDPNNIKWVKNGLLREMSLVASGNKEKIKVSLIEDNVYQEAAEILLDYNRYRDIFEPDPEAVEIEPVQE
jgi:carboxyl-terminal processing protease